MSVFTKLKLLQLAKKHRMNTDVRRAIFCTVMSSEDYFDAFEKIQGLNLKGKEDREIIFVILQCAAKVSAERQLAPV